MKNIGGDEPFGGDISRPGLQVFGETDRIMAFDVVLPLDTAVPDVSPTGINFGPSRAGDPTRTAQGGACSKARTSSAGCSRCWARPNRPPTIAGNPINWPNTPEYCSVGLVGQMEGSIAWHSPTTENPALDSTEEWEIWNVTGDAHPVHLHLVHFEILGRDEIKWDSNADEDGFIPAGSVPANDGTYLVPQPTVQHNSVAGDPATYGIGFRIVNPTKGGSVAKACGVRRECTQGHGHGPAWSGHPHQGDLRQTGPLRLALPHPLPRRSRNDARDARRPGGLIPIS